jgi:hypothetical protein
MIVCKNPNPLIELMPNVLTQNRLPVPLSGINAANVLLATVSPLPNTSDPCVLQIPLPVELLAFTAATLPQRKAGLRWTTATETDNAFFIVERSANTDLFDEVIRIDGAGNSQHVIDYTFTDEHPLLTDVSYYRLRQVDIDGDEEFSPTVAVRFPGNGLELVSAVGDRTGGSLRITIRGLRTVDLAYRITDATGRLVASGTHASDGGVTCFTIEAYDLASGIYAFTLTSAGGSIAGRLFY